MVTESVIQLLYPDDVAQHNRAPLGESLFGLQLAGSDRDSNVEKILGIVSSLYRGLHKIIVGHEFREPSRRPFLNYFRVGDQCVAVFHGYENSRIDASSEQCLLGHWPILPKHAGIIDLADAFASIRETSASRTRAAAGPDRGVEAWPSEPLTAIIANFLERHS